MEKDRLDVLIAARGLATSREKARALIMAGHVLVNGERVEKPGKEFPTDVEIAVQEELRYVSRGGLKLEAALDAFNVDCAGLCVLDAGASTGGFTDCLLKRGAAHVIAVDVGYGQFDWGLRNDPGVTLLERTNIRFLSPDALPRQVDAAVADLSFISLTLVLPVFAKVLPQGGWLIALVKPQFEVGRGDVAKGGVVRDPAKVRSAVDQVKNAARKAGFSVMGEVESPIRGPKGNREIFLHLVLPAPQEPRMS
ncbi:MAG: TlyA family RNA methyltransferase [Desulfomonile sp.]|nr:TlyA family RNA methyltransferase [Desulfomonile sp.]